MEETTQTKGTHSQENVKTLDKATAAITPEPKEMGQWRNKLGSRQEKLKYLQTAERYWYSKDWFGSEKRKTQA